MPFCPGCHEPVFGGKCPRCPSAESPRSADNAVPITNSDDFGNSGAKGDCVSDAFLPRALSGTSSGKRDVEASLGQAAGFFDISMGNGRNGENGGKTGMQALYTGPQRATGVPMSSREGNVGVANGITPSTPCAGCGKPLGTGEVVLLSDTDPFHPPCTPPPPAPQKGSDTPSASKSKVRNSSSKNSDIPRKETGDASFGAREEKCSVCRVSLAAAEDAVRLPDDTCAHRGCLPCSVCGAAVLDGAFHFRKKTSQGSQGESITNPANPGFVVGHRECLERAGGGVDCSRCARAVRGAVARLPSGDVVCASCLVCSVCSGDLKGGFAEIEGKFQCGSCVSKSGKREVRAVPVGERKRGFVVDPITGQKKFVN